MSPAAVVPLAITDRVAFDALGGFSPLFRRYVVGDDAALRFFARDWRASGDLAAAAREAADLPRDRETLAEVLREQNAHWANDGDDVRDNIEALRRPGSAAVVTGQQLGLFGGPLYTVYKAITAVQLASREAVATGRAVVPVFWLAGEDHDWEEVRSTVVLRGAHLQTIELPPDAGRQPVGRRVLREDVTRTLDRLETAIPPTAFTPELMRRLRACYREGASVRDAFARFLAYLFDGSGLVIMSSDEPRLKRAGSAIFERELSDPAASLEALLDASRGLQRAGFHNQVAPMAGNLFLMEPEGRFTLDPAEDDGFAVRGLNRRYTLDELRDRLANEPEAFSANVVLRPILEDSLLPTLAYVAGPGETAYYAQLRGIYQLFGVPMPVVYPRVSATLIEPAVRRVLERYDLAVAGFGERPGSEEDTEALFRRLALRAGEHGIEQAFDAVRRRIDTVVADLAPISTAVDSSLAGSVDALRARLARELARTQSKVVRAEKRNHHHIRADLETAVSHLFPSGSPQERALGPIHLINHFGPEIVRHLIDALPLDTSAHVLVEV
jgi:bacillithiol synthase